MEPLLDANIVKLCDKLVLATRTAYRMLVADAGIVHKGDGSNLYVRRRHVITPLLRDRGGVAGHHHLVSPVSLASAADGSLYVADSTAVRKLKTASDDLIDIVKFK